MTLIPQNHVANIVLALNDPAQTFYAAEPSPQKVQTMSLFPDARRIRPYNANKWRTNKRRHTMTVLPKYNEFEGLHGETGSIRNALAYQGVKAPHTGKPISEALLLGVSGGITVGYFTFEYQGYNPHIALLTRNTFSPMETIFDRLAIPRDVLHTSKPETAMANLIGVLESGHAAIVWADMFSLPYNLLPYDARNWGMTPLIVYGVEGDRVYIADRSHKPFTVTVDELQKARGRVKDDKFRVMSLDAPDMDKLPGAVQKGIWQCISLYTEAPPRGKRDNFGLAALQYWAKLLTNTRNKQSWERYFAPGKRMYMALAGDVVQPGAFDWICTWGAADGAERGLYADFLDEAAVLLNKPGLTDAARQFRAAASAWCDLANAMLPDSVPAFKETRDLKLRRRVLFVEQGGDSVDERRKINARLEAIRQEMATAFPLTNDEAAVMRATLAEHVLKIHDIEAEAVSAMQAAVA
jgi:hypothetical protein